MTINPCLQIPTLLPLRITQTVTIIFPIPMNNSCRYSLVSSLSHSKATIPFLILTSPAVIREMCPHPSREFGGPIATPFPTEYQAQTWVDNSSSEFSPPAMQEYGISIDESHSSMTSPMQQGQPLLIFYWQLELTNAP
jgi:hypothetical protein